jgi:ABC-type molybdate transport system substrate-binding protein
MIVRLVLALLLLALPARAAETDRMIIFADETMRGAIQELAARFERATIHRVTPVFAASAALADRIENGTHPDLLLVAGSAAVDRLDKRGLLEANTRVPLVARRPADGSTGAAGRSPPVVYQLAMVASRDRSATRVLYDFLRSAEAGEAYRRHGFLAE